MFKQVDKKTKIKRKKFVTSAGRAGSYRMVASYISLKEMLGSWVCLIEKKKSLKEGRKKKKMMQKIYIFSFGLQK